MLRKTVLALFVAANAVQGQNPFEGAPNPGNDPCSVCGVGMTVGNPTAVWVPPIPGFDPVECGLLEQAGLIGFINPITECPAIPTFINAICECTPGEATLPPTNPPIAPTPAPVVPATPAPVVPATPAPVVPATPAPVVPATPAPVVPATPAPVVPATPAPVVPATPAPVVPATPAPVVPATPAPVVPATPAPVVPATPAPVVPATPAPVIPATPAPVIPATDPPTDAPAGPQVINLSIFEILEANEPVSVFADAVTQAMGEFSLRNRGPFTVFVPANAAFDGIDLDTISSQDLQDIILYHIVQGATLADDLPAVLTTLSGETIFVDGLVLNGNTNIVQTDVVANNGIIHVIDSILAPLPTPATPNPTLAPTPLPTPPPTPPPVPVPVPPGPQSIDLSIFEILSANLPVSVFADAITQAMGEFSLRFRGPFTVFAPANFAFDGLNLNDLSTELLQSILLYHVVPGKFLAEELPRFVTTLRGDTIRVNGLVLNGNTAIVQPNTVATNGVVHVIDNILRPPMPVPPRFPPTRFKKVVPVKPFQKFTAKPSTKPAQKFAKIAKGSMGMMGRGAKGY